MITGISIENFKGVRDRVDIEFKPITLLFGANSAGKSTILHALHYAREVFERRNLDPEETVSGGNHVDLGGFEKLVHNQERGRTITLRVQVDTGALNWPSFNEPQSHDSYEVPNPDQLFYQPDSLSVELSIVWSEMIQMPFVQEQKLQFDGREIATVSAQPGRKSTNIEIDLTHPCLAHFQDCGLVSQMFGEGRLDGDANISGLAMLICDVTDFELDTESPDDIAKKIGSWRLQAESTDALLDETVRLEFGLLETEESPFVDGIFNSMTESCLHQVLIGPSQVVAEALMKARYLGPVRDTPPRNFRPQKMDMDERWASGLGAWDTLSRADEKLVTEVSDWLQNPAKLDSGYGVERFNYIELDIADDIYRRLVSGLGFDDVDKDQLEKLSEVPIRQRLIIRPSTNSSIELAPCDVGAGISQVLPVVVAALDSLGLLVTIEQPELHLHPRLQAELADLFVQASGKSDKENQNHFLLETHSEHLVLRLLRRIRETEKKTQPEGCELRTDDLAIYYAKQEAGSTIIERIDVDVKGEFIQPWPDDFFELDFFERFS